jgi:cytochrome c oxidase subunit 4
VKTFSWLFVLMAATVIAAQFHLGPFNVLIAFMIAGTKATLVVLNFMDVRFSSKLVWAWAALGFIWLAILFTTLSDYITRDWVRIVGW